MEYMARTAATARIMEGGRVVLPAPFRKALCLKPGDQVITGPFSSVRNLKDGDEVRQEQKKEAPKS